jgi:hypothetical protein
MTKRRKGIIAIGVVVVLAYCGAYAYFRLTCDLIHRKTWNGTRNYHSIQAGGPGGRDIFGALLVAAHTTHTELQDPDRFDSALHAAVKSEERRRLRLLLLFAPCRWAESACWYVLDWRRDEGT